MYENFHIKELSIYLLLWRFWCTFPGFKENVPFWLYKERFCGTMWLVFVKVDNAHFSLKVLCIKLHEFEADKSDRFCSIGINLSFYKLFPFSYYNIIELVCISMLLYPYHVSKVRRKSGKEVIYLSYIVVGMKKRQMRENKSSRGGWHVMEWRFLELLYLHLTEYIILICWIFKWFDSYRS